MRYLVMICLTVAVMGCSGPAPSERGGEREHITPARVEVVSVAPEGAEMVGMVRAYVRGDASDPGVRSELLHRLKRKAAGQGGNVVVIDRLDSAGGGTSASGGIGEEAVVPTGSGRARLAGKAMYIER